MLLLAHKSNKELVVKTDIAENTKFPVGEIRILSVSKKQSTLRTTVANELILHYSTTQCSLF